MRRGSSPRAWRSCTPGWSGSAQRARAASTHACGRSLRARRHRLSCRVLSAPSDLCSRDRRRLRQVGGWWSAAAAPQRSPSVSLVAAAVHRQAHHAHHAHMRTTRAEPTPQLRWKPSPRHERAQRLEAYETAESLELTTTPRRRRRGRRHTARAARVRAANVLWLCAPTPAPVLASGGRSLGAEVCARGLDWADGRGRDAGQQWPSRRAAFTAIAAVPLSGALGGARARCVRTPSTPSY